MSIDTLDITDCKLHNNELRQEIANRVKETQRFLIRPYPNKIVMTLAQYEELKLPGEEYKDDTFFFRTPDCIMEVVVRKES